MNFKELSHALSSGYSVIDLRRKQLEIKNASRRRALINDALSFKQFLASKNGPRIHG